MSFGISLGISGRRYFIRESHLTDTQKEGQGHPGSPGGDFMGSSSKPLQELRGGGALANGNGAWPLSEALCGMAAAFLVYQLC